jgi:hypothetical protein
LPQRHRSAIQLSQVATAFEFSAPGQTQGHREGTILHLILCYRTESEEPLDNYE